MELEVLICFFLRSQNANQGCVVLNILVYIYILTYMFSGENYLNYVLIPF